MISMSIVVILGIIVVLMNRKYDLGLGHALVCVAFGVFLGPTKLGMGIHDSVISLFQFLNSLAS